MYGLPSRPLTYEDEVVLDLCMDRACRRLAKIAVEAHRIANGGMPPEDWFAMDADSEREASRSYYDNLLAHKVNNAAARNRARR